MAFGVLAGQITVIFLEVLLGYVGARSGIIKDRDSKFLSDFIMKLLLPCTMLAGAAVDGEPELLTQAGVLFVLLLALFVVTTGLCRLSSWLHHDTPGKYAVMVGTAAMPNCGFIGLPLCSALLGTARGTVFAGMAMASYNVWFFTYVVCLFRPGEKIRLKTFITPTNIATVAMLVLLATGAAWEGFDFPGDCVSLLIIPRLPFAYPDARKERELEKYPSLHAFIREVAVPEMQIKLRQGFGRAIRTESDTCVIAILDERACRGRRYAQAVSEALPEMRRTGSLREVTRFLREKKPESYFEVGR